jgi:hypothetical protein
VEYPKAIYLNGNGASRCKVVESSEEEDQYGDYYMAGQKPDGTPDVPDELEPVKKKRGRPANPVFEG